MITVTDFSGEQYASHETAVIFVKIIRVWYPEDYKEYFKSKVAPVLKQVCKKWVKLFSILPPSLVDSMETSGVSSQD
jgi:hypothetical protein